MTDTSSHHAPDPLDGGPVAVVGAGRMGHALVAALDTAEIAVVGPLPRGATGDGARIVLLAVPDASIADAARLIAPGALVGHLSGALDLEPLRPHESFSIHPLMTVTAHGAVFDGVSAAVDASSERADRAAHELVAAVGMSPIRVAADDRAAYHAAASVASNFLIVLEDLAESLANTAGVPRSALVPLVRASVENWSAQGSAALTGPIVRGDVETVARQRAALEERFPDRVALFDALTAAASDIVTRREHPEAPLS